MASNDVSFNVVAHTEKALADIKSFGDTVKTVALGAAAFLGGQAILGGIQRITDEASNQENALQTLNSALALSGDYSEIAARQMEEFASNMQASTGVADDVILQQLALAKSFGASNEQAKELVDAALNLSAATGQSLDSSVRNLGKSLGGTLGELGEMIPALKDMTVEQLKAGDAIGYVLDRFGGAAQDKMKTFTGAVTALKTAQGELLESLGNIIIKNPVVIASIKALGDVINTFTGTVDANSDVLSDMVSAFVKLTVQAVGPAIKAVLFFVRAGQGIVGLSGLVTIGFKEAELSILSFNHAILKTLNVAGIFDKKLEGYRDLILEVAESQNTTAESVANTVEKFEAFNASTEITVDQIDALIENIKRVGPEQAKSSDKAYTALGKQKDAVDTLNDSLITQGTRLNKLREIDNGLFEWEESVQGQTELWVTNMLTSIQAKFKANQKIIEGAFDFGNMVLAGKEGARKFLGSIAGEVADYFAHGLGKVVAPFVEALSQGPEKVGQMADEFFAAIPELIDNIAEALPIFIEKLAENTDDIIIAFQEAIPKIVGTFIQHIPEIVQAFIQSWLDLGRAAVEGIRYNFDKNLLDVSHKFGDILQKIVDGFADFFNNIGKFLAGFVEATKDFIQKILGDTIVEAGQRFFDKIIESAEEFFKRVTKVPEVGGELGKFGEATKGALGGLGGFVSSAGHALGFASGGQVPSGFPNDTFQARLTSGELVIPPGDTERLSKFLDDQSSSDTDGDIGLTQIAAILSKILQTLTNPTQVNTEVKFNDRALADILLSLSRKNARVA